MTSTAERTLRSLFKRCVQCPPDVPACPVCEYPKVCSMVPLSCDDCPYNVCIDNPSPPPKPSSGPNVGAIAGGVIGGVIFVLVVMFLLWRFWIRKRREQQEAEALEWEEEDDIARVKSGARFTMRHGDAASTRTRGSLAHSIMSRMSNVIHIAFVPGVTARGDSGHNSLLTNVPVPPIPAAYANPPPKSPLSNDGDAIMFRPEDLRASTYSDTSSRSGYRDTQYTTRQSISPSILSEIYRDDATVDPMPATAVTRHLPRVVSIKSTSNSSPTNSTTSSNPTRLMIPDQGQMRPQAPRSLSGGTVMKPTQVNIKKGRFPIRQLSDASTTTSSSRHAPSVSSPLIEMSGDSESEEDEHARARRSLLKDTGSPNSSAAATPIMQPKESPFFDASELPLADTPPPPHPALAPAPPPLITGTGASPVHTLVSNPASASTNSSSNNSSNNSVHRPNPYAAMSSSVGTVSSSTSMSSLGSASAGPVVAASATAPDHHPRPRRAGDRPMGGLSAVIEEATRRASKVPSQEERDPFSDVYARDVSGFP